MSVTSRIPQHQKRGARVMITGMLRSERLFRCQKPQTTTMAISPGGDVATAPEFPVLRNGVWVIGRFEGYHTFLSTSERSIYTEINFRVLHVFGRPGVASLQPGSLIDIGRPGGTIVAPWSQSFSRHLYPRDYDFQPHHSYLALLLYQQAGAFYMDGPRRWDLTGGTALADTALDHHRAEHGNSEIIGLTTEELIRFLDRRFASN